MNAIYALSSPGNCTQHTKKQCHCLPQHRTTFTVKFSHNPLVCQGHHLKSCNMASESRGGTSSCFPTAAVVLAKLGCMPQSIDQSGLSAVWDACMQTLAECSSPQRHLQPSLGRQGGKNTSTGMHAILMRQQHESQAGIDCNCCHEGEDKSTLTELALNCI